MTNKLKKSIFKIMGSPYYFSKLVPEILNLRMNSFSLKADDETLKHFIKNRKEILAIAEKYLKIDEETKNFFYRSCNVNDLIKAGKTLEAVILFWMSVTELAKEMNKNF